MKHEKNRNRQSKEEKLRVTIDKKKESESELAEAGRKWNTLVENMSDPVARFNKDLRFVYVNQAFLKNSGLRFENVVGRTSDEIMPELEWLNVWNAMLKRVLKSGEPEETEISYSRGQDGRRMITKVVPEYSNDGAIHYLLALGRDISEQKEADKEIIQHQTFLLKLSDDFGGAGDEKSIGLICVNALARYMGLNRCYITELSEELDRGVVGPEYCEPTLQPISGIYSYENDPGAIERLRRGLFVVKDVVNDTELSEVDKISIGQRLNLGAMISTALYRGGRNSIWTLSVGTVRPHAWTGEEIRFVQDVGERTWRAIERARAEKTVRQSEEKYRTLFNSIDEGFCIIERVSLKPLDFVYVEANPAFASQSGIGNVPGKTIREVTPDEAEEWFETYNSVLTSGKPLAFERELVTTGRVLELYAFPFADSGNRLAIIFKDITERKKAEQALRDSEARLSALVSAVPTAISLIDLEGKLIYSNKEMQYYVPFGMMPSLDEENYWRWQAWNKDGDFIDRVNFPGALALRGETVVPGMEMLFTHKSGTKTWTRVSAVPVKSNDNRILGTVSVITDIDELKRTAEALINSSQQLALSLDAAKMGIFEWNSDDKKLKLSRSSAEIYGLTEEEPVFSNEEAYRLVHFEDIEMRRTVFEQPGVLAAYYHEYRIIRPLDGKMAWIAEKGKAYRDSFTGITTIRGVHWDITEKKKIEEALRSSERSLKELNENLEQQVQKRTKELMKLKLDQEKEKLNTIIFTQEQERARISEGLHDGVAQLLYAVQNRLQMIKPHDGEDKELRIAKEILTEAIEDTRKISFELMPPLLKDYGLEVCLSNLINKIVGDRLKLNWDVSIVGRLPDQLEITIYRIVQEILNNTLKHAKATEAGLSIKISDKYVKLRAYDNGVGFSVKKSKKDYHGIGLQSIRNRVKLLNGKMQISSAPGTGTVIELQLPLIQK